MIINAHAHIYPDKIADRAVCGIEDFYHINVKYNGTLANLSKDGEEAGVSRFIVQSVATVPEQVNSINNFIASSVAAYPDKLIGLGTMHPDYPDITGEIERMISLGLRGIKIHNDFQHFNLDDERAFPIYEAAEGRLPILFHMGDTRSPLPRGCCALSKNSRSSRLSARISRAGRFGTERFPCLRAQVSTPTAQASFTRLLPSTPPSLSRNSVRTEFFGERMTRCGAPKRNLNVSTKFPFPNVRNP